MVERADSLEEPERAEDEIASLRRILLDPERRQLASLQSRLDDLDVRAHDVGEVLPQALHRHAHNPEIARALAPALERAVTTSVRRNPKPLADALFPIMGPAIRKAVAASLAGMVESLNRTLDHSFSRQSIRWRIEASRTGKTFAEVVLLQTLLFRVEQVMLIDRKTGLLLQHAHTHTGGVQDADMVSGMLTAIRDFVQDSFRVSERVSGDDSLESLKVGDLAVWVEAGPHAILAAVIRGTAPRDFRRVLQDTLEHIHLEFGPALESFEGDASTLNECLPILEECLRAEYRSEERQSRSGGLRIVAGVAVLAFLAWAGLAYRDGIREARYLEVLRAEPGIAVVSTTHEGGRLVIAGLRDPKARDPLILIAGTGLASDDVEGRWSPYYALDPSLVLARAHDILQPPGGTSLALRDGILSATGTPPAAWVSEARRLAPLIAGVSRFDAAGALDALMRAVIGRIEGRAVLFNKGASRPVDGQNELIRDLAQDVRVLDGLADAAGQRLRVEVLGHTDADGPTESNLSLSRARAGAMLAAMNLEPPRHLDLEIAGIGSTQPVVLSQNERDKQQNRRVTIRVIRPAG